TLGATLFGTSSSFVGPSLVGPLDALPPETKALIQEIQKLGGSVSGVPVERYGNLLYSLQVAQRQKHQDIANASEVARGLILGTIGRTEIGGKKALINKGHDKPVVLDANFRDLLEDEPTFGTIGKKEYDDFVHRQSLNAKQAYKNRDSFNRLARRFLTGGLSEEQFQHVNPVYVQRLYEIQRRLSKGGPEDRLRELSEFGLTEEDLLDSRQPTTVPQLSGSRPRRGRLNNLYRRARISAILAKRRFNINKLGQSRLVTGINNRLSGFGIGGAGLLAAGATLGGT